MKLVVFGRLTALILLVAGFGIMWVSANLLGHWIQGDGLVQYPDSQRLSPTSVHLDTLVKGYVSQSSAYRAGGGAARVLSWYARLGLAETSAGAGPCQTLSKMEDRPGFRYALAVTLCSQPSGTLIFVDRSLAVR